MRRFISVLLAILLQTSHVDTALQPVNGLVFSTTPHVSDGSTSVTLNATGESVGIVGTLRIEDGASSKTLSAAGGGAIFFSAASITMADGGTTFSVGIQDVNTTTGVEDGTFDVKGAYTGGGSIPVADLNKKAMTSGTKTMSDGDIIVIVAEMESRAGADTIVIGRVSASAVSTIGNWGFPYGTVDTSTLIISNSTAGYFAILFDDGTLGWIEGSPPVIPVHFATVGFNSGSTPDEYIGTWEPQFKMEIRAIGMPVHAIASADNFEVILYSDPYGTPVAERTITVDPDVVGGAAGTSSEELRFITPITLTPGTVYGIAVRPTTANSITITYANLFSAEMAVLKDGLPFKNLKMSARSNQSGAFAEVQTYHVPLATISVSKLDDGVSSGGEHSYVH